MCLNYISSCISFRQLLCLKLTLNEPSTRDSNDFCFTCFIHIECINRKGAKPFFPRGECIHIQRTEILYWKML